MAGLSNLRRIAMATNLNTVSFTFIKNLLLAINFLSMMAGIILMAGGAYIVSNKVSDIVGLSGGIAAASIIIGILVTIISFLGCFGAANEKGILLKTYFIVLCVVIILEIAVGAAAYAQRDNIPYILENSWKSTYAADSGSIVKIQNSFECCGYNNVTDHAVPETCSTANPAKTITVGCKERLSDQLMSSLSTIGGAGIAIGVIELVGSVFSAILFHKIARKDSAQTSLLNEAWRVNRNKVQYG